MKKVICPGEVLIDFVSSNPGRDLKEAASFIKKAGGAPANVAAAISKLGAEAFFCGTVGNDAFGDFLRETLEKNNINTELMFSLENSNTTLAFVSLMEDGERDFNFVRDADAKLRFDMIDENLNMFDIYHFGSATAFLEGSLKDTYYSLKEYAIKNNKLISFDANYRESLFGNNKEKFVKCSIDFIRDSHIVKLSEEEAYLISGINNIEEASNFIVDLGCKNLITTLGSKGAMLTTKEEQVLIPTNPVKMIDATGAGDAFMGAILAQILNNPEKNIKEVVEIANIVGGITTTRIGALESIPTWEEVLQYIK